MARLVHFTFPPSGEANEHVDTSGTTITGKNEQLGLQLHIEADMEEGYKLTVPVWPARTLSTPPSSPTKSSTMGTQDLRSMHDSGAITPPVTPTSGSHSKSNSASSDFLNTLSSLRRSHSTSLGSGTRPATDGSVKPGSTELITFPYQLTDYEFRTNSEGKKKTIGEGAWSDVYLASPSLSKPTDLSFAKVSVGANMTPPHTPMHSRNSSLVSNDSPVVPPLYAIKVPAMTSAKKVLSAEARILSYLSRFPDAIHHIVPYYGLDTRTGSLVLKAMDGTLESWIQKELNTLDEASRAQKLAIVFPIITLALIDSLQWMHNKYCIHADIKPSNILVSRSSSGIPQTVYSDFSSTTLTKPDSKIDSEASPFGAGTWDYLDPILLSTSTASTPLSESTDLWSLAITLLFLVLGASPYDAFKANRFQQREMIKSGAPLQCLDYGDEGLKNMKRLNTLSRDLGFNVQKWFAKVLVKDVGKRVTILEWREELVLGMQQRIAKI